MSLVAWYPLNGNTNDYSGNGYHLTGTPTYTSNGKIGQAVDINRNWGSSTGFTDSICAGDFSVAFWIKIPYSATYTVSQPIGTNTSRSMNLFVYPSLYDFHGSQAGGWVDYGFFTTDTWIHVTVVFNKKNGIAYRYKNGTLFASSASTTNSVGNTFQIGNPTYYSSDVELNDIRFYDHALSEKEIKEIAKAKILHYTFDDFQEPTNNLYVCPKSNSEFNVIGNGIFTVESYSINEVIYKYDYTQNLTWTYHGMSFPVTSGVKYTYSCDVYISANSNATGNIWVFNIEGNLPASAYYNANNKGTWQTLTGTVTASGTGNATFFLYPSTSTIFATTGYVLYRNPRVEQKTYSTPFINGSRSGIVNDQSGFRNNAILTEANAPQWIEDNKIGSGCYNFDGVNHSIKIPIVPTPEFSMSLWFYKDSWGADSYETLFGGPSGFELESKISTTNSPKLQLYNWGGASYTYTLEQWNHVVFKGNATESKLYLNGSLVLTGTSRIIPAGNYFIGSWRDYTSQNFKGKIDDFRIYATYLSDADILELYQTRASIDNNGNLYSGELYENLLNRCPPFEKWTLSGGATVSNGILTIPNQSASAVSPYIYIGPDSNWSFRGEYFSTGTSIQFSPDSGYLQGSSYFDDSFQLTVNTANYTGNGNAQAFPINTWTIKKWSYLGGNLVRYIKISISGNGTYTSSTGYQIRNPMLTSINYDGPYIPYSDRLLPNTEIIKTTVDKNSIIRTNLFSEVGITDGLIAYYPFDKDANDYSGSNLNGTVSGAVLTNGVKGQGYSFDGVDDYIRLSSDITTGNSDWSVTAWVKTTSTGKNTILSNYNSGPVYNAICTNNGKIAYNYYNNAWLTEYGNINIADGVWHFLCWCNTGLTKKIDLYVDGVKDATVNSQISAGTGPVNNIGRDWGTATANAILDEIRIYNRILSAEEVAILYETTSPTSSSVKITKDTIYTRNEIKEVY